MPVKHHCIVERSLQFKSTIGVTLVTKTFFQFFSNVHKGEADDNHQDIVDLNPQDDPDSESALFGAGSPKFNMAVIG